MGFSHQDGTPPLCPPFSDTKKTSRNKREKRDKKAMKTKVIQNLNTSKGIAPRI